MCCPKSQPRHTEARIEVHGALKQRKCLANTAHEQQAAAREVWSWGMRGIELRGAATALRPPFEPPPAHQHITLPRVSLRIPRVAADRAIGEFDGARKAFGLTLGRAMRVSARD